MKYILSLFLTLYAINGISQNQSIKDSTFLSEISKAKDYVQQLKSDQNIPSVSIAVGHRGKIVWADAIGLADVNNNVLADITTKYRIGSIGKSITALALGQLFDNGKIEFDQDVTSLFPELNTLGYPLTIRQIAGHQGGIRHYNYTKNELFSNKQYNSVKESLSIFINDKIEFEPGTKYMYSTYGYVLLGRVIEMVTNEDYREYMLEKIFKPLKMTNTFIEDAGQDESNLAKFYSNNGKREVREVNLSNKWAGGAFISTPSDLVSMINNAREIVDVQTLFDLITVQNLSDGTSTGYGMGFRISNVQSNNRVIVHHGGRSVGARSFLLLLPAEQIVVAICTNSETDFGVKEVYQIAEMFIK